MEDTILNEQVSTDPAAEFLASSAADEELIEAPSTEEIVVEETEEAKVELVKPSVTNESDKISQWKIEQTERIAKKDQEEESKKAEWKAAAKKELEDWYKLREETLAKTHAKHKEVEQQTIADSKVPGKEWQRLSDMCDFNPRTNKSSRDLSRMRGLLLMMKQQPLIR